MERLRIPEHIASQPKRLLRIEELAQCPIAHDPKTGGAFIHLENKKQNLCLRRLLESEATEKFPFVS